MKYINTYICVVLIAIIAISVSSCNDFLDRSPLGSLTKDDETDGGLESQVFGIYSLMRGYGITAGIPAHAIHMYRSEDSEKGSDAGDGSEMEIFFDNFNYNTTIDVLASYWTDNYDIINKCNAIITEGDTISNPSQTTIIVLAEARFFRAYCFFNLVRAWGEVPKIDFAIKKDVAETNIAKASVAEIYELIDKDLTVAVAGLPPVWESKFTGRLTWGAARSLQARTFMMRNDFNQMYTIAKDVIESGIYNLDTPVDKIFTDAGENCGSSIFELQCMSTPALPDDTSIGSQFCQVQGVRGSDTWDLGWGWHMATNELLNKAFEPGDPRKNATLLYFRRNATDPITSENTNTPYGESPISSGMGAAYNKKAYTDPAMRALYTKQGFWVNIRLIRYPDVLLMASEAANELGNTTDALAYLEQVRGHARGNNTTILPQVTTTDQTELRKAIQHERRVELALEPDRFYDLVRWGIAKEVLHAAGKTNYQDKHKYLPIPQTEIDRSNGVLKQNPNY